jgi:hypothetical protein
MKYMVITTTTMTWVKYMVITTTCWLTPDSMQVEADADPKPALVP